MPISLATGLFYKLPETGRLTRPAEHAWSLVGMNRIG